MSRNQVRLTFCASIMLAASAAIAVDPNEEGGGNPDGESRPYSWGLGLAGLSQQQSYTGIDRDNLAVPLIYFENRWVQLFGPWLDIKLPSLEWSEEQQLSFGMRAQLFGVNGYEADDAPILNGMDERKESMLVGGFAKWSNPIADVSAEWLYDVSGESEGQRIKLGVERMFPVGERFLLTPGVTATWLDEKYADYYYGVRATEARANRPAYNADSTMNLDLSVRADYIFDEKQSVFAMLEYSALGGAIEDSPLTDRANETMLLMGYLYRF